MTKTNLIIDGNNILYRTFHANNRGGEPDDVIIGMCLHSALMTLNKYFKMFNADDVIVTFDSYSWRKEYTEDLTKCVTNKKYKGHRRQDQTPKQQELQRKLDDHLDDFCEMLRKYTSVIVLRRELLEGDDLMAAWVQMHRDDNNVVITGDKDLMQLLRYDGVKVINPADDKERKLDDWNNDPKLFLFEKFFRGEAKTNDNIQSAYPKLRKDKIVKAYSDEYDFNNLLNHRFTQLEQLPNGEFGEVEYLTKDVFYENKILMDLTAQPKPIKVQMVKTILEAKENRGKYNHLKFLRFCTVNELTRILERVEDFVPMLNVR